MDYPWGVALSRVVSVLGTLQRWRGYFTSQVKPRATFLLSWLLFWGTGARGLLARTVASYCVVPSTVFPTRGYWGMAASTPESGDTHTWRRPHLATSTPGDAQSGQLWLSSLEPPLVGPATCLTLTLTLTLVNAQGRVDTVFIIKNMLKLAFMDAGSCVRTGVMDCKTVCQICTYVLNKICSYIFFFLDNLSWV